MKHRRPDCRLEKWKSVDWGLADGDIAKLVGVTRQCAQYMRSRLNRQPKNEKRKSGEVRQWLQDHKGQLPKMTWAQVRSAIPHPTSDFVLFEITKEIGTRPRRTPPPPKHGVLAIANIDQFVAKHQRRSDLDECWEWKFGTKTGRYGYYRRGYAHRVVYELFFGEVPTGLWVLHRCDNPPCVNPNHLYAGTPKDNSQDRERRGRSNRSSRQK